jgi:hypothetical protein
VKDLPQYASGGPDEFVLKRTIIWGDLHVENGR